MESFGRDTINSIFDEEKLKSNQTINLKYTPTHTPTQKKYKIEFCREKNKVLFTLYINIKNNIHISCLPNMQGAHSSEDMLYILRVYKQVIDKTLKIGKYKLFGEIIKGEVTLGDTKIKDSISGSIQYWKKVQQLEEIFREKFKIVYPLNDNDSEMISILINSFIMQKPSRVGQLHDITIRVSDKAKLENIKGAKGNFSVILSSGDEKVCGVSLKSYVKILFYGPIQITDYEILEENVSGMQCRLLTSENSDTVAAVMYFKDKPEAENFLKDNSDKFMHAKYPGEECF